MAQNPNAFDPLTIAISGTNLIEASAGTGKTYGIAALFTRLIVLEQKSVDRVLVVTFTKAATAELKNRLRARLDEVLQVLDNFDDTLPNGIDDYCNAHHAGDVFLPQLLKQALQQESRARLIVRLKAAIGQFDNAAIYTIHGFCQRILRDYAFLCQAPTDIELIEDQEERLTTAAQDFWREHVGNNPELAEIVFKNNIRLADVLNRLSTYTSRPYLTFRRPTADLAQAKANAAQCWQNVRDSLSEIETVFWANHPNLNGNSYRQATFTALFKQLTAQSLFERLPFFDTDTIGRLNKFSTEEIQNKLKKNKTITNDALNRLHILADLGGHLAAVADAETQTLIRLQLDLIAYLNQDLDRQKKNHGERSFDDLLLDVHTALTDNPHKETLARTVAQTWETALIDEFQDTDPLQYEIFQKIFIAQNRPLFLVGDPKQAIYSFRGADIYAYLQAAQDAQHRYTLATNYRSHAKLINGIGALFHCKDRPFVLDHINYSNVGAARAQSRLSPPRPAIQVRWLNEGSQENKDTLRRRAAEYCADEIAFALNEAEECRLNFKDRPLQSGDIAVLVRTHNEATMIAQALKQRRIQSVLLSRESVFASPEAAALSALLGFWLDPRDMKSLRFALTAGIFGYDAARLHAFNQNESEQLFWTESAQSARNLWQTNGIFAAMQQFAQTHGIEPRLLSRNNERSLTNYFQLLEILSAEDAQSRNPAALAKWLRDQISRAEHQSSESRAIRLESDEALVKIVTMHASKGLQYPLVYCPFAWDAKEIKPEEWQVLHQEDGGTLLLHAKQFDEAEKKQYADEEMAERLRLFYVALTRAEEQLNIYAAYNKNTKDNPFAYLLEGTPQESREAVRAAYSQEKNADIMLKQNWENFCQSAPADTEFYFTDGVPPSASFNGAADTGETFRAAEIPERSFRFIRHTSFTGLSRHTKSDSETHEELQPSIDPSEAMADGIEIPSDTADQGDPTDIHHFPRGTQAGICLHKILEETDFKRPAAEQSDNTAAILQHYGFEEQWLPAVLKMTDICRLTPLSGRYSLADMPESSLRPEMGFTFHARNFRLDKLQNWFAQTENLPAECLRAAQNLDFPTLNGFLNGFIDMVCQDADGNICIIDYKSNHLGNGQAAYTQQAMNNAVAHHHYYLQALVYALAVFRLLKLRRQLPPTIAVRYLFLRGMDGTDNGIWQWDIDTARLEELAADL